MSTRATSVFFGCRHHVDEAGAERGIRRLHRDGGGRIGLRLGRERTVLRLPLLAAPIEQFHVLDAINVEDPGTPGGEPVVGVAVEDDGGVFRHAGIAEQRLEVLLRYDVALYAIDQIAVPGDVHRARDMAALVEAGIDADLDHPNLGVGGILLQPIGADQEVARLRREVQRAPATAAAPIRANRPMFICASCLAIRIGA